MNVLIIDGVRLPTPDKGMKYSEYDLAGEAYRDAAGVLHKTTVRYGVRKLFPTWNALTNSQLRTILNAVRGKEYFTVQYYCADSGNAGTFTAYKGDIEYKLTRLVSGDNAVWTGVGFNLIER